MLPKLTWDFDLTQDMIPKSEYKQITNLLKLRLELEN